MPATQNGFPSIKFGRLLVCNDGGTWGDDPDKETEATLVLRSTDQTESGQWSLKEPALRRLAPSERHRAQLLAGDLVMTKSSGSAKHIGKTTIVSPEIADTGAAFSNFMQRFRLRSSNAPQYYWYVTQSRVFRNQILLASTTTTGLSNLAGRVVATFSVPQPSLKKQQQIADYLDHETAEIDALLIGLESMKDLVVERSGAERDACIWSQDQPLIPLRRLIKYVDQGSSPQVMSSPAGPGEVGILKSGCTNFGVFNPEANKAVPTEMKIPEQSFVHEGDLIVSRASGSTKHVGSSAVVPSLDRSLALSDKHYRLHVHDDVDVHYLAAVLRSRPFRNELEPYISGAPGLAKNISISSLKAMHVPHLSAGHQREISRRLQKSFENVQEITRSIDHAIDLARERRAALITAAVTGQIDVTAKNKPAAEQLEDDVAQGLHREYA